MRNSNLSWSSKTNNKVVSQLFIICLICIFSIQSKAQWLDFQNETDSRLVLSSVASSDNEEKDFSTADLNNDGWMDVIVVRKEPFSVQNDAAKSDLLLMNINGVLTDQTALYAPEFISTVTFARDVVIDDFDGDGWLDVVIANTFGQQPIYYKNQGNDGNGDWLGLIDETSTRFPFLDDDVPLICAVWSGDIDGDLDQDLYFVNYKVNAAGGTAKDFLLINDGSGVFTNESEARLGNLRNSAFGTAAQIIDFDNDGDNDILKISTLYSVSPWNDSGLMVLFNDGTGNFSNWVNIAPFAPYMFEVADYNDDGLLDVFVVDDGADYVLITNSVTPDTSIDVTRNDVISGLGGFGGNVHKGDLDLDGDIDIIVSDVDVDIPPCNSGRKIAILQNNNGLFTDLYANGTYDWADNSYDLSILDINQDGLLDFITGGCDGYGLYMSDNCDLITGQADLDGDGLADACDPCPNNPDLNCIEPIDFPTVSTEYTIARQWNEMLLESIRKDFARPTSHARNLYHHSAAMYDVWAAYDSQACNYLLGKTVDGFTCNFDGVPTPSVVEDAIHEAISYMSYKFLKHRFQNSPNVTQLMQAYDNHMTDSLGYDISFTSMDYSTGSAAALGNYIAECYIDFGLQDGSNEQNDFANQFYLPVNDPLVVDLPGNPNLTDFNRWQPLTLELFIDQSGNEIPGSTPDFLSPEWGQVSNFSLKDEDLTVYQRDGFDYQVYHDPGTPPQHAMDNSGDSPDYLWGYETVILWSSHLDATDGATIDISPSAIGNRVLPTAVSEYPTFYDQLNGGTQSNGHPINPATGAPYDANVVPRADYARVLAEFWADGPDSETPPGHWFTIINYIDDHPDLVRQYKGEGPVLTEIEWEIKAYFTMGGAMHDCAVTAWGNKGWYDYIRPISAIRGMAALGQRTDPTASNYHPAGIALIPGKIETIETGDPLAGLGDSNVGKIKVMAWKGHSVINNVDTDEAGVDWILAENWVPYQRPSFVTPPFAGYVSGHSTFSRAAAEILTEFTGDEYFPGGMGEFVATQNEFLVFEDGPSQDIVLQWATYRDAADESGLSRIWGGIHPPADDIPGRIMGIQIGLDAFALADAYFSETGACTDPLACNYNSNALCDDGSCEFLSCVGCTDNTACNFSSSATQDDGSCIPSGCMDSTACNYNELAGCDDGSCEYVTCPGCMDTTACNYDPQAGVDDGSCEYLSCLGCVDVIACNYNSEATTDDGSCTYPGCIDTNACNYSSLAGCDDGSCVLPGCTDSLACNYDDTAGCEDGSCTYPGCTDGIACNYDSSAGCDDGTCTYPGCTDLTACNYDPQSGCDDGSCTQPGCTDSTACNYDAAAGCDDGSCLPSGCTDLNACNFDITAQCDNGSCSYPGCNDPGATNYDPNAGCDDGSCIFPSCTDVTLTIDTDCYGNEVSFILTFEDGTIIDQTGTGTIPSNQENTWNYCLDNGCYTFTINDTFGDGLNGSTDANCTIDGDYSMVNSLGEVLFTMGDPNYGNGTFHTFCISSDGGGCIDPLACNFNPAATFDNGSCLEAGCTDDQSCNYNPNAGCDDGSCIPGGCMDVAACNYDSTVACDNGSCIYGPSNDLCANAIPLSVGTITIDNTNACVTEGYTVPGGNCNGDLNWCNQNAVEVDVFYSFTTPSSPTEIRIETFYDGTGTQTDTQLAVFSDCGGTLVAANDDGGEVWMSRLDFGCNELLPNTTYIILIDGYNGLTGTCLLELAFDSSNCGSEGCTDPLACNYDLGATIDDGSCSLPGCLDIQACNYNPTSTCSDGSCEYLSCLGCTDPTACNYISDATVNDGSCIFPGCTDPGACNYDDLAGCDDGNCEFLTCSGCTDSTACNYDSSATLDDGSCTILDECGICGGSGIAGCTDIGACNFDSAANCDDNSCEYLTCAGCTDINACNYDSNASLDDNSCEYNSCLGCDDISACNFDSNATINDGTCEYPGCTDPGACNYILEAGCDDGTCEYNSCAGCTDITACNFNFIATLDDGSCIYPGCIDQAACNFNTAAGCDDGSCIYPGCTDTTACNFDSLAGCDDASCEYNSCSGCTDITACNFNFTATLDDGSCIYPGCIDQAACNFNTAAGCDDGSCIYPGCTDATACNFDSLAGCDDGSCATGQWYLPNNIGDGPIVLACEAPANYFLADQACAQTVVDNDPFCVDNNWDNICSRDYNCCLGIYGCFDNSACNFDPTLCPDNTLCIYPGCTDITACNYDSTSGCDDGSCFYAPCGTCQGDANVDGFVNILDLVSVSSNFGCLNGCEGNGDANFDGIVNILDLVSVSSNFGNICE